MIRKRWCALAVAALITGSSSAQTPLPTQSVKSSSIVIIDSTSGGGIRQVQAGEKPSSVTGEPAPAEGEAAAPGDDGGAAPLGPTAPDKVNILQNLLGLDEEKPALKVFGWIDPDYTYRSTGHGQNNIAPVMNRFGDEFLMREIVLNVNKPMDPKDWSWGFNSTLLAGSDGAFLQPTAGWFKQTDPRFGLSFTDLNVTAHLPILTEGGVDIKFGRTTTVLGPMGGLAPYRYFDSSDYAWYNLEEGRYTGLSTNWHISKQLSWFNAIELGGWGSFFDFGVAGPCYLGQINYWFDEDAKRTLFTFTVLTGPTGHFSPGNTTAVETTIRQNWTERLYQVMSFQMNYSKAPIAFAVPHSYQQRAYDVYSYQGIHLSCALDFNTRVEWYKDVDGGGYPGGFGIPKTNYGEVTLGFDYHPYKWIQIRPEIRGDFADHPAFGRNMDREDQLSIAVDALVKF
jgi:hypothetical protein